MPDINYKHLRYFQIVAHEGNLTRAAEQLHVSQSAVSTQIRLLEERLGHALFERRGRQLHLTEPGRITLDHADAIFATGRELIATLEHGARDRQLLRVGALATLSRNFQLSFLRPILGRSDVEVILRSGSAAELYQALGDLNLDIVLTNQPPSADLLADSMVYRLEEQTVSLIGVPSFAQPDVTVAEQLVRTPLILPTSASGLRMGFDALISRLGIRPEIAAEVDDMAMMRLLAREGVGLAVLPPIVVLDELNAGHLIEAAQLPELTEVFYGVTVKRRFRPALIEDLLHG